ncbi:sugar phosphate nucleotidyltransferase [Gynurincola endophyticus]|jgi:NDP-sugar pyrophosphorylase family protein|uniref:sugar phosphate nucleotidyltransferase n=1 Tax=Gynurincola endophyticus TaxID=2479004 RepID=UPI000F8D5839|nr:sugar phosphate nucleotidyltransferase [Gynurincola endophyticus]
MKPTLLILAAGMASRYGSMKQIQAFGPSGETIMDYSIYDAIRAGFNKVVFIIRKDFAEAFKAIVEPKLKGKIEVDYVYQDMTAHTDGYTYPAERTKPWGTAHAVLCAQGVVNEPFAVINADDFYGRDAFVKAYEFLTKEVNADTYSIIGYDLLKTLSDNGTVNRGVCVGDNNNNLVSIAERLNISMVNGEVVCDDDQSPKVLPKDSSVSMNFWCFDTSIFDYSKQLFTEFLAENGQALKSEFFIPIVADKFIGNREGVIKIIPTSAQWFGVTYKEDAPAVKESLDQLIQSGEYPDNLWK